MFDNLAQTFSDLFIIHGLKLFMVLVITWAVASTLDWLTRRQVRLMRTRRAGAVLRWLPALRMRVWGGGLTVFAGIILNFTGQEFVLLAVPLVLAFGLATRELIGNLLGGAVLAVDRRFQVGDLIRVGEHEGEVRSIGLRSVHLLSVDGHEVEIPNQVFLNEASSNITPDLSDIKTRLTMMLPSNAPVADIRQIAYLAAAVSRYASPRRRPEVFIDTHFDQTFLLRLTIMGYVFDPAYEDHFRSDVVEIIRNKLHVMDDTAHVTTVPHDQD